MKSAERKTAFYIAMRYLFSKKKHNIIHVISIVSMIGIMVSSAALIIVLSVFNGMETMIGGWFNAFNPDFEITLVHGKSFSTDSFPKAQIAKLPEVKAVEEIVSDMVLATYQDRQQLVKLKGVDSKYVQRHDYEKLIIDGNFDLTRGNRPCAVLGSIAAGEIQLNLKSYNMLKMYYPKRTKKSLSNPADAFNMQYLYPAGVFNSNTSNDQQYVFCSISFARDLMQYQGEATSIEVQLNPSADFSKCQKEIQQIVGPKYQVKNKYQQEETLFKTMQSEKLVIYIILAFILLVAAFNIIGSLGMLILEKKTDTAILSSVGAKTSLIQRIFIYEGMCISFIGGLAGMALGAIVCLLQQSFHLIKFGNGGSGYLIQYYPVQMSPTDFLIVLATILVISLLTSFIPAYHFKKATVQTIDL